MRSFIPSVTITQNATPTHRRAGYVCTRQLGRGIRRAYQKEKPIRNAAANSGEDGDAVRSRSSRLRSRVRGELRRRIRVVITHRGRKAATEADKIQVFVRRRLSYGETNTTQAKRAGPAASLAKFVRHHVAELPLI